MHLEFVDRGHVMPRNVQRGTLGPGNILPNIRPPTNALDVPWMLAIGHGQAIKSEHMTKWTKIEQGMAAAETKKGALPWHVVLEKFNHSRRI